MKDSPPSISTTSSCVPSESLAGRMTVHYAGPGIASRRRTAPGRASASGTPPSPTTASPPPRRSPPRPQELTAGKTDFYDKTEAIADFVQQQIRYFVIEIGIGGYQPHSAGDIFRNRYGDCKDKATLLSAMLSTVGIHSDLVMVDTAAASSIPTPPPSSAIT